MDAFIKTIIDLQNEYMEILKAAKINFETENSFATIDEISIFWKQKEKIVEFILSNISNEKYDTILYTASTFFDFGEFEQYPFVTIGKNHIFDDPIVSYIQLLSTKNILFNDTMKEKIILGIENNIKIIETLCPHIILIPVRYLYQIDGKLVMERSDKCFLSLFTGLNTIDEYLEKINTIDDINNYIKYETAKGVSIDMREDKNLGLVERFQQSKNINLLPVDANLSAGQKFRFQITSNIIQVINIMDVTKMFGFIPFLRYNVAFSNMMSLSHNFIDSEEMKIILSLSAYHYIIYKKLNMEIVKNISFTDYIKKLQEYKFHDTIIKEIGNKEMIIPTLSFETLTNYLSKRLEEFYLFAKLG